MELQYTQKNVFKHRNSLSTWQPLYVAALSNIITTDEFNCTFKKNSSD